MPGDLDTPLEDSSRTTAARRYLAGLPSSSAVTARKRSSEMLALIESERLLARTNVSGVREVAPEITYARDLSTAVTAVHRAVELDAFAPPSVEVTVVVNQTVVLAPPEEAPVRADHFPEELPEAARAAPPGDVELPAARVATQLAPSRAPGRARRVLAALLFAAIMVAAVGLLAAAVCSWAGLGRTPQEILGHVLARTH